MEIRQFLTPDYAAAILEQIKQLDDAFWVDRQVHNINKTITGKPGLYSSAGREALPIQLYEMVRDVSPVLSLFDFQELTINRYPKGGYIPKHRDVEGYAAFAILTLEDGAGQFIYYDDQGKQSIIDDKAGQIIVCKTMTTVHEVPKTNRERFSVIYLYL